MSKASVFLFALLGPLAASAQQVLHLQPGQAPGKATLAQMQWLAGYWVGPGMGGDTEELWLPAADNSMVGVFRYLRDGELAITEYMFVEEGAGSLTIRLKHFNRDLTPWEGKDEWVAFPLVKIEGQTAWFDGITYQRKGDQMLIWVATGEGDKVSVEEFRQKLAPLPAR